jgi:hypothetical protein
MIAAQQCLIQRLGSLVENLEILVVGVNATVIAQGGFAGNVEFGQVFEAHGAFLVGNPDFSRISGPSFVDAADKVELGRLWQSSESKRCRCSGFCTSARLN